MRDTVACTWPGRSAHRHDLDVEDVINHMNRGTAKPEELLPDEWKQSLLRSGTELPHR